MYLCYCLTRTIATSLIAESRLPEGDFLQHKTRKDVGCSRRLDSTLHLTFYTCELNLEALLVDERHVHDFALLHPIAIVALPGVSHDSCPQHVPKSSAVDTRQAPLWNLQGESKRLYYVEHRVLLAAGGVVERECC